MTIFIKQDQEPSAALRLTRVTRLMAAVAAVSVSPLTALAQNPSVQLQSQFPTPTITAADCPSNQHWALNPAGVARCFCNNSGRAAVNTLAQDSNATWYRVVDSCPPPAPVPAPSPVPSPSPTPVPSPPAPSFCDLYPASCNWTPPPAPDPAPAPSATPSPSPAPAPGPDPVASPAPAPAPVPTPAPPPDGGMGTSGGCSGTLCGSPPPPPPPPAPSYGGCGIGMVAYPIYATDWDGNITGGVIGYWYDGGCPGGL